MSRSGNHDEWASPQDAKSSDSRWDPLLRVRRTQRRVEKSRTDQAAAAAHDVEQRADALSQEIERLAKAMQANKRQGTLNVKMLQQLDALSELFARQRNALRDEADQANDVLQECQSELERANQNVRAIERLKELQHAERSRRRDAA